MTGDRVNEGALAPVGLFDELLAGLCANSLFFIFFLYPDLGLKNLQLCFAFSSITLSSITYHFSIISKSGYSLSFGPPGKGISF